MLEVEPAHYFLRCILNRIISDIRVEAKAITICVMD